MTTLAPPLVDPPVTIPPEDGWYERVPAPAYHQWRAPSSSLLRKVARGGTWRSVEWALDHPSDESSPKKQLGTAVHYLALEPELAKLVQPEPTGQGKSAKIAEMVAASPWGLLLPPKYYDYARWMADALLEDELTGPLLRHATDRELTGVWTEEVELADGSTWTLRPKMRLDVRVEGVVLGDVKTTADVSDAGFTNTAWGLRYDLQDALYLLGAMRLGFEERQFVFLCVENEPPFDVWLHEFKGPDPVVAEEQVMLLLEQWAQCEATGTWPGHPPKINQIRYSDYRARQVRDWIEEHRG